MSPPLSSLLGGGSRTPAVASALLFDGATVGALVKSTTATRSFDGATAGALVLDGATAGALVLDGATAGALVADGANTDTFVKLTHVSCE